MDASAGATAGTTSATASNDKTARVWAMDSPTPRRVMTGHLADVDCVAWHPNVNYIATGSADKTVRMWDVATGECVRVFVGHVSGVRALALSPDGKSLASASEDGQVLAWDLGTARQTHAFVGHRGPVYSLDYAGGGRGNLLASGGADETVRLWDTAVGVDLADAAKKGQNARKGASGRDRAGCAESAGTDENAAHEIDARVRGVVHGEEPAHGHGRARAFLEGGVNRWLLLTPFVERLQEESSRVARSNSRFFAYVPLVEQRESASLLRASELLLPRRVTFHSKYSWSGSRPTHSSLDRLCSMSLVQSGVASICSPGDSQGARSRTACPSSDDSA